MSARRRADSAGGPTDLAVAITDLLAARGVERNEYTLYDYCDTDALERLLASTNDVEVRLTVEGIRLSVTPGYVAVLEESGDG